MPANGNGVYINFRKIGMVAAALLSVGAVLLAVNKVVIVDQIDARLALSEQRIMKRIGEIGKGQSASVDAATDETVDQVVKSRKAMALDLQRIRVQLASIESTLGPTKGRR